MRETPRKVAISFLMRSFDHVPISRYCRHRRQICLFSPSELKSRSHFLYRIKIMLGSDVVDSSLQNRPSGTILLVFHPFKSEVCTVFSFNVFDQLVSSITRLGMVSVNYSLMMTTIHHPQHEVLFHEDTIIF
jgi:hypothetical protein